MWPPKSRETKECDAVWTAKHYTDVVLGPETPWRIRLAVLERELVTSLSRYLGQ